MKYSAEKNEWKQMDKKADAAAVTELNGKRKLSHEY